MRAPLSPRELDLPFDSFRQGQRQAVDDVLAAFESKSIVILEGPTGSGKSLLAMAVAAILKTRTVITTQTKQLAQQYHASFPFTKVIEGRDNFQCPVSPGLTCAEGPCIARFPCDEKYQICPYYIQKSVAINSGCVITNIWYYINEANYVGALRDFDLLVVDEGHLLEQALLSVVSIDISVDQLSRVGVRVPPLTNVNETIHWAGRVLPKLIGAASAIDYEDNPKEFVRYQTQVRRLSNILNTNEKEWLLTKNYYGYSLKPVWVRQFGAPLVFNHAENTLVMSATIRDPKQFSKTLGIASDRMAYVEVPSYFPKQNRPINYWPVVAVGHKTSLEDLRLVVKAIDSILERHRGQKGIIHTVSYSLRDTILLHSKHPNRFVSHNADNRDAVVKEFKASNGEHVLISPSLAIGLDLPDDQGRFNVVVKLPFGDLGDAQIKKRQREDPDWYIWTSACALIQSTGRTTRTATDWSVTYILDQNAGWFMSRNEALFPKWWKETVYRINSMAEAVLPPSMIQSFKEKTQDEHQPG